MKEKWNGIMKKTTPYLLIMFTSAIAMGNILEKWRFEDSIPKTEIKIKTIQSQNNYVGIQRNIPINLLYQDVVATILTEEELAEEIKYGEMELISQIVQAEAGNQDLEGMRLVADVVLNRMDSKQFPNTAEEVIFQKGQFGPTVDGAWEKAGWNISQNAYKAVEMEWEKETRLNSGILYFNTSWDNGKNAFKHGDHWFSY